MVGGGQDRVDLRALLVGQRAGLLALQEFGIAEDGRERRAQLVGDVLHELVLQLVGGLQRFVLVLQRLLHLARGGHVHEGDQRRAVRQRLGDPGDGPVVRRAHHALVLLAVFRRGVGHAALDRRPDIAVVKEARALVDHGVEVRAVVELRALQLPQLGERVVVQAQAAVGAEHHHRFAQVVERRLLDVDQAVEFRLQREFVGDVLEQQQHAAERVALARHAQDAAVGQVPEVLDEVDLLALVIGSSPWRHLPKSGRAGSFRRSRRRSSSEPWSGLSSR